MSSRPPRIDTGNMDMEYRSSPKISVELMSASPTTVRTQALPSFRVSISPNSEKPPPPPSLAQPSQKTNSRARNESQKLLAHLLGQLQNRPMPPPVFDAFKTDGNGLGEKSFGVVETVRGAVKLKSNRGEARTQAQTGEDDEDEEGDHTFSTDATFELMMQLKEVLIISVAQGWHIFHDGYDFTMFA